MVLLLTLFACTDADRRTASHTPPAASLTPDSTHAVLPAEPSEQAQQPEIPTGQPDSTHTPDTSAAINGEVTISFDYERISGPASNQYAVWIEDMEGNLIKTLYASQWTARGGYTTRPDSIALWAEKSNLASMSDYEVDAVSGATPSAGTQSYIWDLTDANDSIVYPGEYRIFVEGTLRWKNYVLFSCVITISGTPMTVQADADFVYEASDRYDALTSGSPENAMIGAVTVSFVPAAERSSS